MEYLQEKSAWFDELERSTLKGGGPKGSRLPAEVQEVVGGHLPAGRSISATARATGSTSRDQVGTVRYPMFGLTLAEVRRFKRRLRDA